MIVSIGIGLALVAAAMLAQTGALWVAQINTTSHYDYGTFVLHYSPTQPRVGTPLWLNLTVRDFVANLPVSVELAVTLSMNSNLTESKTLFAITDGHGSLTLRFTYPFTAPQTGLTSLGDYNVSTAIFVYQTVYSQFNETFIVLA